MSIAALDPWQMVVKISGSNVTQIAFAVMVRSNAQVAFGGELGSGSYEPEFTTIDSYYSAGEWSYEGPPSSFYGRVDGEWAAIGTGTVHSLPSAGGEIPAAAWTQSPFPAYAHNAVDGGGGSGINVPNRTEEFSSGTSVDLSLSSRLGEGPRGLMLTESDPPPYDEVMNLLDTTGFFALWTFDASNLTVTFNDRTWVPVGVRAILEPQDAFNLDHRAAAIWVMLEPESD